MFEGIGRLHDYLRRSNLQKMASHKIATGESVDLNRTQGKSSFVTPATVSTAGTTKKSAADKMRMAAIRQKMKNGDKLSGEDMRYLKENDTALYRKARVIESAREELERDLKQARTKGEARLAMVRAAMKVSSEAAMADAGVDGAAGAGTGGAAASRGAEGVAAPSAGANAATPGAGEASPTNVGEAATKEAAPSALAAERHSGPAEGTHTAVAKETAEAAEKEVQEAIAAAMKAATEVADAMARTEVENKDAKSTLDRLMDGEAADEADAAMPPTALLIIRALQKTWMAYINSDAYKDLPNDERDEAREKASGGHVSKAVQRKRHLAAAFSYHQAAQSALQMAEKPDA